MQAVCDACSRLAGVARDANGTVRKVKGVSGKVTGDNAGCSVSAGKRGRRGVRGWVGLSCGGHMMRGGYKRTGISSRRPTTAPTGRIPEHCRRRRPPDTREWEVSKSRCAPPRHRAGIWAVGWVGGMSGQVADARGRPPSRAGRSYRVLAGALIISTWAPRVCDAGAARAMAGGSPGTTGRPPVRLPGRLRPGASPARIVLSAHLVGRAGQNQMKPP